MDTHLIAWTISPVQTFLRQSRKAQDFWSGSLLLSLMSREALVLLRHPGPLGLSTSQIQVVSPFVRDELLLPDHLLGSAASPNELKDWALTRKDVVNIRAGLIRPQVTNEILVKAECDLAQSRRVATRVAEGIRQWWRNLAAETLETLKTHRLVEDRDRDKADEQIAAQFDVVWAVVPFQDAATSVGRIHEVLAAAKRSKRVTPYEGDARFKCTLSGQWEQLGPDDPTRTCRQNGEDFWADSSKKQGRFVDRVAALGQSPDSDDRRLAWAIRARLEGGGRERLSAPFLVKRLAPVLTLRKRFDWVDSDDESSPLRFPSTTSIAWVEQKARLADLAKTHPAELGPLLESFRLSVEEFREKFRLPLGRHRLPCYERFLKDVPEPAQSPLQAVLRLDGSWLVGPQALESPEEGRLHQRAMGAGRINPDHWDKAVERFAENHDALEKRVEKLGGERIRLGRMPPLALLRADADRLGKYQSEVVASRGLEEASRLSRVLGSQVLRDVVRIIEEVYWGKVIFAGGDEVLAMLPAAWALPAAEGVAQSYERAGRRNGFDKLTCSVAVAVVSPNQPLRAELEALDGLLSEAKNHRRPGWPEGRHAFGLAVVPGSGNLKRGFIGLAITPPGATQPLRHDPRDARPARSGLDARPGLRRPGLAQTLSCVDRAVRPARFRTGPSALARGVPARSPTE